MRTLELGEKAADFDLPGVDGQRYSLGSFSSKPILAVVFWCNHCPYVKAYELRTVSIQSDYASKGVQFVAINSNDEKSYPEDSFPEMVKRAKEKGSTSPTSGTRPRTRSRPTAGSALLTSSSSTRPAP
ncbi:MAG: redoxin family protein [Candidatus Gagatemarchaeaceae archaeon]